MIVQPKKAGFMTQSGSLRVLNQTPDPKLSHETIIADSCHQAPLNLRARARSPGHADLALALKDQRRHGKEDHGNGDDDRHVRRM